jgi:peptide/nickel transport system substrate-binding protein
MDARRSCFLVLGLVGALVGCAAPARGPAGSDAGRPESAQPSRTLIAVARAEPPTLAAKGFRTLGLTADLSGPMFNAGLVAKNDAGLPVPLLAEAVPQLNTDSWRVFPDGTMETTYRLKPGITYHDGQPLTAEDWVFAFQVYTTPDFAAATEVPLNLIDGVTAPDPRTVVVHWKQTYIDADALTANRRGFPSLPRHILAEPYRTQDPEAFMANPYFSREFVGLGPYKLVGWELGSYLEGVAFDGYIMGKARIPRIREVFINDPNTAMANMLSGAGHLTTGDSIRFTDGETLRDRWSDQGKILNAPNLYRITQFQRRPEFATTQAFNDLRVRQALSYGFDFPSVNEAVQAGRTQQALGPIPPTQSYFDQLARAVPKYEFDPRKTEQLMLEAGFVKGSDGVWNHPTNPRFGRMSFETNVLANPDSENEMHLMSDAWRKQGFDIKEVVWGPAIGADPEVRATFPGLSTTSTGYGEDTFNSYRSDRIGSRENRWRGSNRGAWPAPAEFDRMVDVFETTLDRGERTRAVIEMNRIYAADAVVINLYFKLNAQAVVNGLVGPRVTDPEGTAEWNLYEWEFR